MLRRIILIVVVLGIFAGIGAGVWVYMQRNSGNRLLRRAQVAVRAGQFDKAADLASRYTSQNPRNWKGHYVLAQAYLKMGKYDLARNILKKAHKLAPDEQSIPVMEAETYAVPARQAIATPEAQMTPTDIAQAAEKLTTATTVLREIAPTAEDQGLEIRHSIGINEMLISEAHKLRADIFERKAEVARLGKSREAEKQMTAAHKEAQKASDLAAERAIVSFLEVAKADPSRDSSTELLVTLCLKHKDKGRLEEARAVLSDAEAPSPDALAPLYMHDMSDRFESLDAKQQADRLQKAAERFQALLEKHPDHLDSCLNMAHIALLQGEKAGTSGQMHHRYREVDAWVDRALELDNQSRNALLLRANVLMKNGKYEQAEKLLYDLKADNPRWPAVHYAYAEAAEKTGKSKLARNALREVTRLNPTHLQARARITELLLQMGASKEAFQDAAQLIKTHPDSPRTVELYVRAAVENDQPGSAANLLRETLQRNRHHPIVMLAVARGYRRIDQKEQAEAVLGDLAELEPKNNPERFAVAVALRSTGKLSQAEKVLTEALRAEPGSPRAIYELGQLYHSTGRHLQAAEMFEEACQRRPEDSVYGVTLAQALADLGQLERADEQLERILQREPNHAEAALLSTQVKVMMGQKVDTSRFARSDSEKAEHGLSLAMSFLSQRDYDRCIEACRQLLKERPDNAKAMSLLAQAYYLTGRSDEYVAQCKQLITLQPEDRSAYIRLASYRLRQSGWHPDKIALELAKVPGARRAFIEPAVIYIAYQAGDHDAAVRLATRVLKDEEMPQESRLLARMNRASALIASGKVREGLNDLDHLAIAPGWSQKARHAKATVLLRTGKTKEADRIMQELLAEAKEQKSFSLLERLTRTYIRAAQPQKALVSAEAACRILPRDARPLTMKGDVLRACGKPEETVACYRKAIEYQPGDLENYRTLVRLLDRLDRREEALAILDEMSEMNRVSKAIALQERAFLLVSWGLPGEAAKTLSQLNSGTDSSLQDLPPQVLYSLGIGWATLDRKEQAAQCFKAIPEYAPEFVAARVALAHIQETSEQSLAVLKELRQTKPSSIPAFVETLRVLHAARKHAELLQMFEDFGEKHSRGRPLPEAVSVLLVNSMVADGQVQRAAAHCLARSRSTERPYWRNLAVHLRMDTNPEAAATILPAPDDADIEQALLGMSLMHKLGNRKSFKAYAERYRQIRKQRAGEHPIPARYQLFGDILTGQPAAKLAGIVERYPVNEVVTRSVVQDIVDGAGKDGHLDEAAELLRIDMALQLGLRKVGHDAAMKALKQRPSCQYAAALAYRSADSNAQRLKILGKVQPQNSLFVQALDADLAMKAGNYKRAAELFSKAAEAERNNAVLLLNHGLALENLGQYEKALAVYSELMESDNMSARITATNNMAYLLMVTRPSDQTALQQARSLALQATQASPKTVAFQDTLGWAQHLTGQNADALKNLRQVIKALPHSPEVHYHLGKAEARAGNDDLARWHLSAAVQYGSQAADKGHSIPDCQKKAVESARRSLALLNGKS
ncbi:MAG: tetratricopeptide repeat protein [Phycisphaerae bacterium]